MTWDELAAFEIPKVAADALDLRTLRARAQAAGVQYPSFEYHQPRRAPGKIHITCRVAMAAYIADHLRALVLVAEQQHNSDRLLSCTEGCIAVLAELEKIAARDKSAR